MPADQITIEIDLGNDAMRTGDDVADALRRIAQRVAEFTELQSRESGIIHDANGNTCGSWSVQ